MTHMWNWDNTAPSYRLAPIDGVGSRLSLDAHLTVLHLNIGPPPHDFDSGWYSACVLCHSVNAFTRQLSGCLKPFCIHSRIIRTLLRLTIVMLISRLRLLVRM